MKEIFIIGGGGYVGSRMVPYLLDKGYHITVYDLFVYGNYLKKHKNLNIIQGDVRDIKKLTKNINDYKTIIHMACISNDPGFDLNPIISRTINYDCFIKLLENLKNSNSLEKFIYASSSSSYGSLNIKHVTEKTKQRPITDYAKYKMLCEIALKKYNIPSVIFRPATICGYSPRLRLDLVLNILTTNALINKEIKIFNGELYRPNVHIMDMIRAYEYVINSPEDYINNQVFNIGLISLKVKDLSKMVKNVLEVEYNEKINLKNIKTNDTRSYHMESNKIKEFGFEFKYTLEDGIREIAEAYYKGMLINPLDNPIYHNIKLLKNESSLLQKH